MNKRQKLLVLAVLPVFAISFALDALAHGDHKAKPPSPAQPAAPGPKAEAKPEKVEEIEVAEVAEITPPPPGPPSILDLASRFHPPLVHMPTAWLLLLVMVDAATFLFGKPWEKAGRYIGALTAASCVPAIATGLLRERFHSGDAAVKSLITTHKWLAIAMASMVVSAVVIRLISGGRLEKGRKYVYLALVFGAGGLVALVGHKGGQIVFGADFLPLPF